jgi:hypothetical protein|tara:strand:- start:23086 stop:23814 length:729 start_codon:yes stop_codon:yes gene_type:complete
MINSVRNTVLAIINKNNYGYISPSDFNLFAKQAQLDIFDEYFYSYNQQINKENSRVSGTEYADIKKGIEEVIDTFSVTAPLAQIALNVFSVPTTASTGSDYYLLNKVLCSSAGIYKGEAEQVSNSKITLLNSSLLTAPSVAYPAYTQEGNNISIFPVTYNTVGDIQAQYIRYPLDPKWTYATISNGDPLFDQSQTDYRDFELPIDDSNNLVAKILQYAGMSIREGDVVKFGQMEEQIENQQQ